MILVTGAAGKSGRAIIRALRERDAPTRALVHREPHVAALRALGAEAIVGDLLDEGSVRRALDGVRALYLIAPNVHPAEERIGRLAIRAARAAGVEHIVYHSVFHPHIEAMPHHWQKARIEAHLFESDVAYTILQPAPYLQNLLAYRDRIVNEGRYAIPYSIDARLSAVDLAEVAEVAARLLTEPGHTGATYELCGTAPRSHREIARLIGRTLKREIEVERIPPERWAAQVRARDLGDYQAETLMRMFDYYDHYGYAGSPRILEWLLGRAPTEYAAFIDREFAGAAVDR